MHRVLGIAQKQNNSNASIERSPVNLRETGCLHPQLHRVWKRGIVTQSLRHTHKHRYTIAVGFSIHVRSTNCPSVEGTSRPHAVLYTGIHACPALYTWYAERTSPCNQNTPRFVSFLIKIKRFVFFARVSICTNVCRGKARCCWSLLDVVPMHTTSTSSCSPGKCARYAPCAWRIPSVGNPPQLLTPQIHGTGTRYNLHAYFSSEMNPLLTTVLVSRKYQ